MIKLSDYVVRYLADHGVHYIFMVAGGAAMHLNDSIGKEKRIKYVCFHHEQAAAIAAEGYTRVSGEMAVVCVTSGPGGTNAITGVLGQWLDSVPVLYLSGQVRTVMTIGNAGLPLRQLGDQEADIVSIVKPITKYAVMVTIPETIQHYLSTAIFLTTSGRPGPVWLDIPLDVQSATIEFPVLERIRSAKRPVFLAGSGIRTAHAYDVFREVVDKLNIPVLLAWNAIDLLPSDHPLNFGRPSTVGQEKANAMFQNADLLLTVGCRMNIRQIGYDFESVAPGAYKISVDIDEAELKKQTYKPDLAINIDAKDFLMELRRHLD